MKFRDLYPYNYSVKANLAIIILISIFVGGFLVLFQPFGLQSSNIPGKIFVLLGYGLVNFVVLSFDLLLLPLFLPRLFSERKWKVGHQVVFLLFIVFTVGLGNYYYTRYFFNFPSGGVRGVILFQLYTLIIAIFPITVITMTNYNRHLKRNLAMAGDMNNSVEEMVQSAGKMDATVRIPMSSKDEGLNVKLSDLFFLQAEGNYIKVYRKVDGKITSTVIRSTMKMIESALKDFFPPLVRTHRSYIVNIGLVEEVRGNSQGLLLQLQGLTEKVPVSRAYARRVKDLPAR